MGGEGKLTQTPKADGHWLEGWRMDVIEGSTEAGGQEAFTVERCLKFGDLGAPGLSLEALHVQKLFLCSLHV